MAQIVTLDTDFFNFSLDTGYQSPRPTPIATPAAPRKAPAVTSASVTAAIIAKKLAFEGTESAEAELL